MPQLGEIKTNPADPSQKARWDGSKWVDASAPAGPKSAPAWGQGAVELPDGSVVRYGPRGGATVLKRAGGGDNSVSLTEDQGKIVSAATEMASAEDTYRDARRRGYNPASPRNAFASFLEGVPLLPLDGAGTLVRDDISDLGRQAELQFSDAQLKAKSGAAAPEAEVKRNVQIYFTRPNQNPMSQDPVTERARAAAFAAAQARSGPGASMLPAFPYTAGKGQSRIPPRLDAMTEQQRAAAARFKGTKAPSGTQSNPSIPVGPQQYNALPKGSWFIDFDGQMARKN
jgi:hypothetical protein